MKAIEPYNLLRLPRIQRLRNLKGKRVIVRAGLNVPIEKGKVVDGYRLERALQTIRHLQKKRAQIILIGHIGRDPEQSLKPVAKYFNSALGLKVGFVPHNTGDMVHEVLGHLKAGSVVLLENLRSDPREKSNGDDFAKELASYADIYVNDAFSVSHRKHASIVGIPRHLPSYAGFVVQEELRYLGHILKPFHPFLFILGGAKIQTKMPLLKKFTALADKVFVGGALANDIMRARKMEIGKSLYDESAKGVSALAKNSRIVIPCDLMVRNKTGIHVREMNGVGKTDLIRDAGPRTRAGFFELVRGSRLVVYNGPLGDYEDGFDEGTKALLTTLSRCGAKVIIGGGDTVTLARRMKLLKKFTFVSTGGGAMLDYLVDGRLPGVDALY